MLGFGDETRNEGHGHRMDQLPNELILEVIGKMSCYDAVRFGATCKDHHRLVQEAIREKWLKRTVLDSFSYVLFQLINRNRSVYTGRVGYICHMYRIPPTQLMQGTRAVHMYPAMWSTYLQGMIELDGEEIPLMISINLTVLPKECLRDWRFRFRMSFIGDNADMLYEEFDDEDLYKLTTSEERRNAAITLLASWYSHMQEILQGRQLRSYKNKIWLPVSLPTVYQYMKVAYSPMRAFICNLGPKE